MRAIDSSAGIEPEEGASRIDLEHIHFRGSRVRTSDLPVAGAASPLGFLPGAQTRSTELLALVHRRYGLFAEASEHQLDHLAVLLQMGEVSPTLSLLTQCHLKACSQAPKLSNRRAGASFSFSAPARKNSVFGSMGNYQAISMRNSNCLTDFVVSSIAANCSKILSMNLENCPYITDEAVATVARETNVYKLYLAGCDQLSAAALRSIIKGLPGLCEFSMWNLADRTALQALSSLTKLQSLAIPHNTSLDDRTLAAILHKSKNLEELRLPGCTQLSDKAMKSIAKRCPDLALLDVSRAVRITAEGFHSVSRCLSLSSLLCSGLRITDDAVVEMALYHGCVTTWDLSACSNLTDAALCTLARSTENLRAIDLSGDSGLSESSLLYLFSSGSSLTSVSLANTNVTDRAIATLAHHHRGLTHLDVSCCSSLTDATLQVLECLPALQTLIFRSSSRIRNYALLKLVQRSPVLEELDVAGCLLVTEVYIMKMRQAAPSLSVTYVEETAGGGRAELEASASPTAPRIHREASGLLSTNRRSVSRRASGFSVTTDGDDAANSV